MDTLKDTKPNWAITFHEVILVFGPFMAMLSLFFTVNLNTYQHNCFLEKIKQIYIFQPKNPGQDMETSKII